ncbi:response regulator [Gordonia rhizosphera]|uniref:Putative two-component response regulator n=1 Tax=Gordonia rhizosphera NBRC 16068 TaxID=1108045 RepID=K6VA33_9ACTN|nr:response regulator transcription factor [Gordonia rhizosphera]GAB93078.1 putative two-component response regulator [Gordonia rhizosphera NBRC 16068]
MDVSPTDVDPRRPTAGAAAGQRILVVDDDDGIRTVVRWQLKDSGFDVVEADDGASALQVMAHEVPLLIVLDLSLQGMSGLDVLCAIRDGRAGVSRDLPVIILSGRSSETDRIVGLDLGADDYLVKPFSPGELAARVRSLLRRAGPVVISEVLTVGPVQIDVSSREVTVSGQRIELTAKEFDLLSFLAGHPKQVFTRHQLLETVWQSAEWLGEATVTEHVHRLRNKLGRASTEALIRTVRGVGYQLDVCPGQ